MSDIALQTGLRALLSARYSLDTIGHNLANANTPGYSRQRVDLTASSPFMKRGLLIGNGVEAQRVQRTVDELLNKRILDQVGVGAGLEAQLGLMSEIEAFFGEPGENALGGRMSSFFTSISDLSTSPSDPILRTATVQSAQTLADQFRQLSRDLGRIGGDVTLEANARVNEVNDLAERIANLNVRIGDSESSGVEANDLRDERDRLLGELAGLVDVRTVEDQSGAMRVLVAGNTLVGRAQANEMRVTTDPGGNLALQIEGARGFVPAKGGALGGLLAFNGDLVTDLDQDIDALAHQLILELNRVHSTGVPADGSFSSLVSTNPLVDQDGDGAFADELLSNAGLPFDVRSGVLTVNVVDPASGDLTKHKLELSSTETTVQDFLDSINAIPGLSADVNAFGNLRIQADSGRTFDFSRAVDPLPDTDGTLGGGFASIGTGVGEPFALADGDTLDLTVDNGGGPAAFQITFDAADFANPSEATAEEVAAAVNADPGAQSAGVRAVVSNGQVFLQSTANGSDATLTVDGGSSAAALGLAGLVGVPATGSDQAVDLRVEGAFEGDVSQRFTFQPRGDGTIGTTPGLVVDVFDADGSLVTSLDVGEGYSPGDELPLADGLTVRFGLGELSATHNDALSFDADVDGDTTDVLVALGLNGLFEGHDADTIAVRADLEDDPDLFASSLTGAAGDNVQLLDLLDVESNASGDLEGQTLGGFYGTIVSGLGFEVSTASDAFAANGTLLSSLEARRDSVSGVNVDEELVDLVRFEQAFSAAAQYISVVNQIGEEVLSLL